jgi:hypothetical protein
MSTNEARLPDSESAFGDELAELLERHSDDVFNIPEIIFLDMPEINMLIGRIPKKDGHSAGVVLDFCTYRDGESVISITIDGNECIVGDNGLIRLGFPDEAIVIDDVVGDFRYWVRQTIWENHKNGLHDPDYKRD